MGEARENSAQLRFGAIGEEGLWWVGGISLNWRKILGVMLQNNMKNIWKGLNTEQHVLSAHWGKQRQGNRWHSENCTHHSGLKLAGALISHNSLLLFFRLCDRVLLHGWWHRDTKSAGHWYLVVLPVEQNSTRLISNTTASETQTEHKLGKPQ